MKLITGKFYTIKKFNVLIYSSVPSHLVIQTTVEGVGEHVEASTEYLVSVSLPWVSRAAAATAAAAAARAAAVTAAVGVVAATAALRAAGAARMAAEKAPHIQVGWFPAGQPFLACQDTLDDEWGLVSVGEKIGWIVNREWLEPVLWKP